MQRLAQRGALLHGRGQQERGQGEDGAQVRALPLRRRQGETVLTYSVGSQHWDAWASISARSHDPPGPETQRPYTCDLLDLTIRNLCAVCRMG